MTQPIPAMVAELESLLTKANEPKPNVVYKPGGLKGGLTKAEHRALDRWKWRIAEAKARIVELAPSLLAALNERTEALEGVVPWLRAALDCPEWAWSQDQHQAAEFAFDRAMQALTSNDQGKE